MKEIKTCAIYARVSTGKQENENQLHDLREFAARSGWTITDEYVDVVSGSGKKNRPQFERMMLDAGKKKFDLLLFWKLDRLSREGVRGTIAHLIRLDGYGVLWHSYSEPFFESCGQWRDAIIGILATLAAQERLNIVERTKAGLARARRNGKILGAPRHAIDIGYVREQQNAGHSLRQIAVKLDCTAATLCRRLRDARG